ncbi:MAG: transporter [Verrucomicrobiota bacterium]
MKAPLILSGLLACTTLQAQNTGGVFGPVVNDDYAALQYRFTLDTDGDDYAHRIHYEQSLNDDFMWRAVVGGRNTNSSNFNFDFFQAELFWELTQGQTAYRTGLRFDLTLRDDDRPQTFGLHWMHQYTFADNWTARFLAMSSADFGDNTRDGINLQTRASLTRRLNSQISLGAELYNAYGTTDNFLDLDDQLHQLGPVLTYALQEDLQLYTGVLFGLTDRSSDPQFRLWLTKRF